MSKSKTYEWLHLFFTELKILVGFRKFMGINIRTGNKQENIETLIDFKK